MFLRSFVISAPQMSYDDDDDDDDEVQVIFFEYTANVDYTRLVKASQSINQSINQFMSRHSTEARATVRL